MLMEVVVDWFEVLSAFFAAVEEDHNISQSGYL
jgi:hypothetical protein